MSYQPGKFFNVLLIIVISLLTTLPAVAQNDKLRVGYAGIVIEPEDAAFAEEVDMRYFRQITRVDYLEGIRFTPEWIREAQLTQSDLLPVVRQWAEDSDFHYVIGGRLRHITDNDRPGFLDGRVFRYDRESDRFFFMNVRSAVIDLDLEVGKFREQLVETIQQPVVRSRSDYVTNGILITVATAAVVGGAILLYRGVGTTGGGGQGPGPGPVN